MSTSTRTPEAESLDIVVVGAFNPAIFHPDWFLRQKLIGEEDAKEAKIKLVSNEVSEVQLCGLRLVCISERLSIGTSNISQAARMQDLLANIFTLLSHIPVTACGINPSVHYAVSSVEYWHKIGHTLAPKELIWDQLLAQPGMQSLTIKARRAGEYPGDTYVTVEPSAKFFPGVFVRSNYHFPLPQTEVHTGAAAVLLKFLEAEWEPACAMARHVAEKIFEKIKADHD